MEGLWTFETFAPSIRSGSADRDSEPGAPLTHSGRAFGFVFGEGSAAMEERAAAAKKRIEWFSIGVSGNVICDYSPGTLADNERNKGWLGCLFT